VRAARAQETNGAALPFGTLGLFARTGPAVPQKYFSEPKRLRRAVPVGAARTDLIEGLLSADD